MTPRGETGNDFGVRPADGGSATKRVPIPVSGPVTAVVGPVYLRLFPARSEFIPPEDSQEWPWAWGAMCRVKFRIGELTTSKRVQQKYVYGYRITDRPSPTALAEGRATVLCNLRATLARHGFTPPEFQIVEEAAEPPKPKAEDPH